jgi:hypothetical protein
MRRTNAVALGIAVGCIVAAPGALAGPPDAGSAHGRDAGPKETPAQRAYRMEYIEGTVAREREITKHHVWTPEMSTASWKHWRRAYRALRIRELAQDDHDDSAVARVDAYLKKVSDHFLSLLTELTAKAPEIPPPPTLIAPAAGAQLAVGSPVSFKLAPYKDAAQYYCWFWEPGGHYWSNWQAAQGAGGGFGTSPECDLSADDPRWSKFHAGKAEFYGRAILMAKTSTGKDYRMWSEPVKAEFTLTGGAAPATTDGGPK